MVEINQQANAAINDLVGNIVLQTVEMALQSMAEEFSESYGAGAIAVRYDLNTKMYSIVSSTTFEGGETVGSGSTLASAMEDAGNKMDAEQERLAKHDEESLKQMFGA